MPSAISPTQTAVYRPGLAWFSLLGSAWVFVLVTLGAFTTSIGAGMAFADWPLSNGSVNPEGWLSDVMMFAEHSHRLSGTTMGLITIGLVVWVTRVEPRSWVRKIVWLALAIVVFQGLLGGFRVKLDAVHVPGFEMTLGQMLKIPHGILAQIFVCVLFALAASLSRPWLEGGLKREAACPGVLRMSLIVTSLIFVQLVIAATMRHNYAGMAIPWFPTSPAGAWLPAHWDFRVVLAFMHRAMAFLILLTSLAWVVGLFRDKASSTALKQAGGLFLVLIGCQIYLGVTVIWSGRNPYNATGHVIVGAFVLATSFLLCWILHRPRLEAAAASTP